MPLSETSAAAPPRAPLPLLGLAALVAVGLDLRPGLVSIGPLLEALKARFALSNAQAALLTAVPDVLMGLLAVSAPGLARRYGRDRTILAALLLLLLAEALRALAGGALALWIGTVGVGVGVAVAQALVGGFVKAHAPERAALVLSVYTAALSLGSTLAAGVSGPLAAAVGWRWGTGVWTLPGVAAVLAWACLARRVREDRGGATGLRARLPFDQPKAWFIAALFAAQNFLFYAVVTWLAPVERERGLGPGAAGLVLSAFTFSFLLANLVAGTLSRARDRRPMLAGFAGLALLAAVGLALGRGEAPFVLAPLLAIGLGGCFTLGMTLPLDHTSDADAANAWGAFMTLVAYLVAGLGPLLFGALRDATGRFDMSLWKLSPAALVMLAVTPLLGPRPQPAFAGDSR